MKLGRCFLVGLLMLVLAWTVFPKYVPALGLQGTQVVGEVSLEDTRATLTLTVASNYQATPITSQEIFVSSREPIYTPSSTIVGADAVWQKGLSNPMIDTTPNHLYNVFVVGADAVWQKGLNNPSTPPPTVSSVSPENGTSDVSIDTAITATFSEPMDASTITTASFTLAGSAVSGTVTYNSDTYKATFTPDTDLDYDHEYTAILSTAITDEAGNPLAEPYTWSFTTESAPGDTIAPAAVIDLRTVEITTSGFVYPTGESPPYIYAGWLATGEDYAEDYYHLAQDMEAAIGDNVYAVTDGDIVYVSVSGWGEGNYGVLVKHRLDSGEEFLALYGHVRPNREDLRYTASGPVDPPVGVRAGEAFATIGPYNSIPHLHFGIHPGHEVPPSPWGRMPLDQWPETNGFVDPVDWITERIPFAPLDPTSCITLAWTAPGDDVNVGTASQYDIRYSTSEITEVNWDSATQCIGEPAPQPAGSSETFAIVGLSSNTTYYLALRTADEVPNWSELSNVTGATTLNQPPITDAGEGQSVSSGDAVWFDGSNSYDPDGAIVSYEWDFGDGETATGVYCSHRFRGAMNEPKDYTVKLIVEDDKGATASDTVSVTVYPLRRYIPVYSSVCQPLLLPVPTIMEVVVYYNWVDEKDGQDEYIVSEVHLGNEESLNFALYMFSIEDEGEKIWSEIHKGVGEEDLSFTYPFGVPRDCVKNIDDEHFMGLLLGPNAELNFVVDGVELGLELRPSFFRVSRTIELGPGRQTELPPICPDGTPGVLAAVASPVELRVYDFDGNVTGLVDGEIREEIPNSIYDGQSETCVIFSPGDINSNHYEIAGTDEGTYGLNVTCVEEGSFSFFNATDIPTAGGAIHQYTIHWDALSQGEQGVTVQVDSDGDGEFENTFTSDNELIGDEFVLQTATVIDFDPDTLNLASKGKSVTVHIELPEGYDVGQINVSSVILNGTVAVLDKPTEIGDYDGDGIPDLMAKFDRTSVQDILTVGDQVEITIIGEVAGITLEGSDTIRVINK